MAIQVSNFGQSICKVKSLFFDSSAVIAAVDTATRKVLNHIGGMIRLTARRSIKKAPTHSAASKAGKPPLSHTGLLKNYIWYSFDPQASSVVVGPVALRAKGKDVPHTLEYGGKTVLSRKFSAVSRTATIAKRPYMKPALEANVPKIAALWKNSVKK
jgi:hypothetical protein